MGILVGMIDCLSMGFPTLKVVDYLLFPRKVVVCYFVMAPD